MSSGCNDTHGAATAVSELYSLLPYMAMARPRENQPFVSQPWIWTGLAPLRHPASSLYNDEALNSLDVSRCNAASV